MNISAFSFCDHLFVVFHLVSLVTDTFDNRYTKSDIVGADPLFYYLLDVKMCQILKHVRCSLRLKLLLHSPSSPSPCSTLHFSGKTLSRCEGHVPVVQVLKYGLQWSRHKACWTWYFQKRHYINKNNVFYH